MQRVKGNEQQHSSERVEKSAQKKLKTSLTELALLEMDGKRVSRDLSGLYLGAVLVVCFERISNRSWVASAPGKRSQQTHAYEGSPDNLKRTCRDKYAQMEVESERIVFSVRPVRSKETYHNEFARGMAPPSYKKSTDA
jgi:hypothetical protein